MAPRGRSRIKGASSLRRKLRKFPDAIEKDIKPSMQDIGEAVRADAISNADSTRIKQAMADPGAVKVSRDGLGVRIGFRLVRQWKLAFFAWWVERGTQPHSLKKGSRLGGHGRSAERLARQSGGMHPGTDPDPFLGPAYDQNKQWAIRKVRDAVRRTVRRVARGG